MAKVIQADRVVAGQLVYPAQSAARILGGRHDDHPTVQAFAAHREASTAQLLAERDELVSLLKRVNAVINAAQSEIDAEWREHDKVAERHNNVVRQFRNDVQGVLSRIQGQGEYTCGGGE